MQVLDSCDRLLKAISEHEGQVFLDEFPALVVVKLVFA